MHKILALFQCKIGAGRFLSADMFSSFHYNRLLLQHDDIISLDVHKSGAKVIRFPEICKEMGGVSQNLTCK